MRRIACIEHAEGTEKILAPPGLGATRCSARQPPEYLAAFSPAALNPSPGDLPRLAPGPALSLRAADASPPRCFHQRFP